jgi:hypothetical protein
MKIKSRSAVDSIKNQDVALKKMRNRYPSMTSGDIQSAVMGMKYLIEELQLEEPITTTTTTTDISDFH